MATKNICPRAHGEGSLGRGDKRWGGLQALALNGKDVATDPVANMADLARLGRPNLVLNAALENWVNGTSAAPAGCATGSFTVSRQTEDGSTFARLVSDGGGAEAYFGFALADWLPDAIDRIGATVTIALDVRTTAGPCRINIAGGYDFSDELIGDGSWQTIIRTKTFAAGAVPGLGATMYFSLLASGNDSAKTIDIRNPRVSLGDVAQPSGIEGSDLVRAGGFASDSGLSSSLLSGLRFEVGSSEGNFSAGASGSMTRSFKKAFSKCLGAVCTPSGLNGAQYVTTGVVWTDTAITLSAKNTSASTLTVGFNWIAWGID